MLGCGETSAVVPMSTKVDIGGDMKFHLELLRDLLTYVEENANRVHSDLENIEIAGYSDDDVTYHVVLATESGLLDSTIDKLPDNEEPDLLNVAYSVHRLTAKGHNFLGSIQDEGNWVAVKDAAKKAGAFTVDAVVEVAKAYLKSKIGLIFGIVA